MISQLDLYRQPQFAIHKIPTHIQTVRLHTYGLLEQPVSAVNIYEDIIVAQWR